tara:strand:+ start:52 stop:246 length:195 start_codon:yes stop_codon:yes gene_type:complete
MELREYLKEKEISSAKFSKKIDVLEATVLKWRYANVIPRKNDMHKIYKHTDGLVTPNDFYGINQ